MQSYTATYTKVFTPDSLLAGLTYPETESNLTADQVARLEDFCKCHASKPVKAFGGSNYTVTNLTVMPSL